MKLQLPTIIIVCLSVVLILTIHFWGGRDFQTIDEGNEESTEFRSIRIDAKNAYNAKDYHNAIELFDQAYEMRPDNAEVCNDLGSAHYDLAIKNAGPLWPAWKDITVHGSAEDAINELDLAIEKVESGYFRIKTSTNKIAKELEAAAVEKGAAVFPYYGSTQTTLNILIGPTKENLLQAKSLYLRAIELKSTYPAPYRNLGSLYMKIGITDKAINFYREAHSREPSDEELAEYLHQFKSGF